MCKYSSIFPQAFLCNSYYRKSVDINLTSVSAKHKAIVQTILSLLVVCFCLYKLADKSTLPEEKALFWGGLSGILGYWLPSPSESTDRHLPNTHLQKNDEP